MKMTMRILLGLAFPLSVPALLHRSGSSLAQEPALACGKGQEQLTPYQTAYLDAYFKSASAKLFQADGALSDDFRKLDTNGNGVLDCSELGAITKQLNLDQDHLKKHSVGMLRNENVGTAQQFIAKNEQQIVQQEVVQQVAQQQVVQQSTAQQEVMTQASVYQAPAVAAADPCSPQCTWECATKTCDQVCSPNCQAPQCQTRCSGMSTTGCQMECGKPRCAVVCPPTPCAKKDCPICKTECSKPMCKLVCPVGTQDCRDVCENPKCSWDCKKPALCPAPACAMKCDPPKACKDSTYKELPALSSGETIVQSFETPLSLLSRTSNTGSKLIVPVAITQAVEVAGSSELKMVHSTIRVAVK